MLQKRVIFPLVEKCLTQIVYVKDRVDEQNIAMQIFMWRHHRNFLNWWWKTGTLYRGHWINTEKKCRNVTILLQICTLYCKSCWWGCFEIIIYVYYVSSSIWNWFARVSFLFEKQVQINSKLNELEKPYDYLLIT